MIELKMTQREEELVNRVYALEDALQICFDALNCIAPGDMPAIEQAVFAESALNQAKTLIKKLK